MKGSMMDYPLTLQAILERIPKTYPAVEIVSRLPDGGLHRYAYLDFYRRAKSLAEALHRAGLQPGDRVGTLCWNHYAHLEAYFGVPAAGGVVHTLNLRLHPQELAFIVNHAQDRMMLLDLTFIPMLEKLAGQLPSIERYVVLTDAKHMPATSIKNAVPYEDWITEAAFVSVQEGDFFGTGRLPPPSHRGVFFVQDWSITSDQVIA